MAQGQYTGYILCIYYNKMVWVHVVCNVAIKIYIYVLALWNEVFKQWILYLNSKTILKKNPYQAKRNWVNYAMSKYSIPIQLWVLSVSVKIKNPWHRKYELREQVIRGREIRQSLIRISKSNKSKKEIMEIFLLNIIIYVSFATCFFDTLSTFCLF